MFTNYLKNAIRHILRRKGYSVINIAGLALGLTCCLLAALLARPVVYYTMNGWLQDFAYKTEIHPWTLLMAACSALAVAFVTVSVVSTRAALVNPVEALRYE